MTRALITGITGQDGSYLAELLLDKGYEVYGLVRRLSKPNTENIDHILDKITLIEGDLTDQASLISAFRKVQPSEIYNLAAQSFVGASWNQGELTSDVTGLGALRVFEAARHVCRNAKIYQASSSEMYGNANCPQNEKTPFSPRSPYGAAKVFAHNMAKVYRESYLMFISCGILFNHESPRRGLEFVTRKITHGIAELKVGKIEHISLGNLETKRDWGYAGDYVRAMWMMLQQKEPDDFVIATGETHSVKDFVFKAFEHAGIEPLYGVNIVQDSTFFRPAEVECLRGNCDKARKILMWKPEVSFDELVKMMVESEKVKVCACA